MPPCGQRSSSPDGTNSGAWSASVCGTQFLIRKRRDRSALRNGRGFEKRICQHIGPERPKFSPQRRLNALEIIRLACWRYYTTMSVLEHFADQLAREASSNFETRRKKVLRFRVSATWRNNGRLHRLVPDRRGRRRRVRHCLPHMLGILCSRFSDRFTELD